MNAVMEPLTFDDLQPTTAQEIADDLASDMPEVQEHVVSAQAAEAAQTAPANVSAEVDKAGELFNPAIHTGSKLKNGLWRRRKIAKEISGSSLGDPTPPKPAGPTPEEIAARASGVVAANLLITTGVVVGGEEFQPRTDEAIGLNERAMLEHAFGDYFIATGRTDFPPGVTLSIVVGMYVLPRLTMPKTQTRISKAKEWIILRVAKFKMRRAAMKAERSV